VQEDVEVLLDLVEAVVGERDRHRLVDLALQPRDQHAVQRGEVGGGRDARAGADADARDAVEVAGPADGDVGDAGGLVGDGVQDGEAGLGGLAQHELLVTGPGTPWHGRQHDEQAQPEGGERGASGPPRPAVRAVLALLPQHPSGPPGPGSPAQVRANVRPGA
jgi:hypothetical protein